MQLTILNNPKNAPLVADAEFLTQSLFDLLKSETCESVLTAVKTLTNQSNSSEFLQALLSKLNPRQTQNLILACSLFAQMLNIAEDVHHERRRQIHEHAGHSMISGSISATLERLQKHNISAEAL